MLNTIQNTSTAVFTYVADLAIKQSIHYGNCAPIPEGNTSLEYDFLCNENFSDFLNLAVSNIILASAALACIPLIAHTSKGFFGLCNSAKNDENNNNTTPSSIRGLAAFWLLTLGLFINNIINVEISNKFSNLEDTINNSPIINCKSAFEDEADITRLICDLSPWMRFAHDAHLGLGIAGFIVFVANFLSNCVKALNHIDSQPVKYTFKN